MTWAAETQTFVHNRRRAPGSPGACTQHTVPTGDTLMTQPAPYNAGGVAPQQQKTNTLAIVALVGSFFVSLVGIICGHIALKQIKETGEQGRGLALAGLIIGYVALAFTIIYIIIAVAVIGSAATYSTY